MKEGIYEVLMIDDGSPDQSRAVADTLAQENAFIRVFSQENKGLGGARNTGIENAKGKYLVFLDADDILLADTLPKLIALAEEKILDILEFGAHQINESGDVIATITKSSDGIVYDGITYYDRVKYMNSACNKLYLSQFFGHNDLQFTENIFREDFEFNTRAFFYAKRIMATNILGAAFLQSANSITRNQNKEKKNKYIRDFVLILELIVKFKKNKALNFESKKFINKYFEERLTISNLGLFYYMFKHNYTYQEMKIIRQELIVKNLYFIDFTISDKKRNLFRKVMMKNFFLFKLIQPLKNILAI
jgi:glycosyltransferase involved in cell wall biosynthesis